MNKKLIDKLHSYAPTRIPKSITQTILSGYDSRVEEF